MSNPTEFYQRWGSEKQRALREAYRKLGNVYMSDPVTTKELALYDVWGEFRRSTSDAYMSFERQRSELAHVYGDETPVYWQEWERLYEETHTACGKAYTRFVDAIAEDLVALVYEPAGM